MTFFGGGGVHERPRIPPKSANDRQNQVREAILTVIFAPVSTNFVFRLCHLISAKGTNFEYAVSYFLQTFADFIVCWF